MGTVIVDLSGDESRLARAYDIAEKKDKSLRDSLAATGKVGQSANEQVIRSLDQTGDKGTKAMNLVLKELRKLGPEGKEAARAVEGRLREAGTHGRKSMDDVVKSLGKLSPEAAKVAKDAVGSFKKVEEQGERSFGEGAITKLAKFATGWMTVTTAVNLTRQAMQKVQEEQQKALDSLKQTSDPNKRLLQVATSEEDYKGLTKRADELASQYGIGRDEARGLMFSARSEGFEGSAEFIAQNSQILGVQSQATVAGQVPGLFKKEGLQAEQAINMGLVAAAESRLNFEEIAKAMPGAAEGGALAGASSSETFGALSVLAGRFKSGDTAADRIKAFTTAVGLDEGMIGKDGKAGRESLQGSGIVSAVEKLQAMSPENRKEFLGEGAEVNAAYAILSEELNTIKARIATIDSARMTAGTGESSIDRKLAIAGADPKLIALRQANAAEVQREIANENRNAIEEAKRQAAVNEAAAGAKNRGESQLGIAFGEMTGDAIRGIPGMERSGGVITEAIAGGDLAMLQRSASAAMDTAYGGSDPKQRRLLEAINLGADSLIRADSKSVTGQPGLIGQQDAATFLSTATGSFVTPDQVTPEIQSMITNQLRSASSANKGRTDWDFLGTGGANEDAAAILPEIKLNELINELRKSNALQEKMVENTSPGNRTAPPVNYGAGLQPAANEASRP